MTVFTDTSLTFSRRANDRQAINMATMYVFISYWGHMQGKRFRNLLHQQAVKALARYAQTHQSLCCSHAQCMDEDEVRHDLPISVNGRVISWFHEDFYVPAMTMARALSVTPFRTYVHTLYVCPNDVRSLNQILIRILWNLVTLFSTIMSSSSLIIVHIAPGFQ